MSPSRSRSASLRHTPEGRNERRYSRSRSTTRKHLLTPCKHQIAKYSYDNRNYSRSPSSPRYTSSNRHYNNIAKRYGSRSPIRVISRSRSRSLSYIERQKKNSREKPMPCRCIGVFGLSVNTTQQKIRDIFAKYGPIERIQVVIDAQTGRSRGFCFIYYENLSDAKAARDNCCGMEIDSRRIRVAYSITQRPHTPTPGVYMGRPSRIARERYRGRIERRSVSPYTNHSSLYRRRFDRSRSPSYTSRRPRY